MTRILLVRHGQSTWNAEGRWQGRADPPLTELGERQALAAAAMVGAMDAIVASPLSRARRTAELIAGQLGIGPLLIIDDLAERDVGPWSGLTFAEIEATDPGAVEQRRWPKGFEDEETVTARAFRALLAIESAFSGGDVIAVSHGGVIRALDRHFAGGGAGYRNLSARLVEIERGQVRLGERLELIEGADLAPSATWPPRLAPTLPPDQ